MVTDDQQALLQKAMAIVFAACAIGLLVWGVVELFVGQRGPAIVRSLMGTALLVSAREIRRAK